MDEMTQADTWVQIIESMIQFSMQGGEAKGYKVSRPSRSPCTRFVIDLGDKGTVTLKVYHNG